MKTPSRPRRKRRRAAWLIGALVLVPLALVATRRWTLFPAATRWVQRQASAEGWDLEVGDVGGNLWSGLELHQVELAPHASAPGPLRSLEIERVRTDYSLPELFRSGLTGLENIAASGVNIVIDLDSAALQPDEEPLRLPNVPLLLPQLTINDASLEVRAGGRVLRTDQAELEIGAGPQDQALRLVAEQLVLTDGTETTPLALEFSGTWNAAQLDDGQLLVNGEPVVWIEELDLRASALGEAHLSALLDLPAENARLDLAFVDHLPRATLHATDLELSDLWLQRWWPAAPSLAGLAQLELQALQTAAGWNFDGRVRASQLRVEDRALGELEALGSWEPGGLSVSKLELLGTSGEVFANGIFVPAEALATGDALGQVSGALSLRSSDLPALLGHDPESVPPAHRLELEGHVSDGRLTFQRGGLVLTNGEGRASWDAGWIDLIGPDGIEPQVEVDAQLDFPELAQVGQLLGWPDLKGRVRGRLQLQGPRTLPNGTIELRGEDISAQGLSLDQLHVAAYGRSESLVLSELQVVRGDDQLALANPTIIERSDQGVAVRALRLEGDGALTLDVEPGPSGSLVHVLAEDWRLTPWLVGIAPDGTRAEGIDGTLERAGDSWKVSLQATELVVPGNIPSASARVDARWAEGRLDVTEAVLGKGADALIRIQGSAPLDLNGTDVDTLLPAGKIDMTADLEWPTGAPFALPGDLGSGQSLGGAQGKLRLLGTWRDLHTSLGLRATNLTAADGRLHELFGDAPADLSADIVWRDGKAEILEATFDAERGSVETTGATWIITDLPKLLNTPLAWDELPIRLKGTAKIDELDWAAAASKSLLRCSGQLGATFDIEGNLSDPRGTASLVLEQATARVVGLPPIESLRGTADLRDRTLVIDELTGELGSGPFRLSGSVNLAGPDGWNVALEGEEVLLLRTPDARVRADLDLTLMGPLDEPKLTGTLGLRRVRLREDLDFLGLLRGRGAPPSRRQTMAVVLAEQGVLADLLVDVRVTSVEPIDIQSNVASGALRGSLQLEGRGNGLVPTGDLFLDPSVIKLPGGRLRLTGGLVRFDPAHPMAPQLDVNGETRMSGYDITLRATGDLDAPQIDLSSTPALPVDQVLLLLLSGQLPAEGANAGLTAARSLTVFLAKDLLSQWSNSGVDGGESWLDRLEIISGQEVSRSGLSTLEASYRLTEDERQDDRAWYVVAERDRYEDVNFGIRLVVRLR